MAHKIAVIRSHTGQWVYQSTDPFLDGQPVGDIKPEWVRLAMIAEATARGENPSAEIVDDKTTLPLQVWRCFSSLTGFAVACLYVYWMALIVGWCLGQTAWPSISDNWMPLIGAYAFAFIIEQIFPSLQR